MAVKAEDRADSTHRIASNVEAISLPDVFVEMPVLWSEGYLFAYRRDSVPSDEQPNLYVFDRKGAQVAKLRLWVEGASLMRILDIAASRDGSKVAVAGIAFNSSATVAGFLADIPVGKDGPVRIVHTSPFEPQSVTFAPDGSLWLVGVEVDETRRISAGPDHKMVQHLSSADVLVGEYLQKSSLGCEFHPASGPFTKIVTSDDRVGIFLPSCGTWVELNFAGELLGRWQWVKNERKDDPAAAAIAGSEILTVGFSRKNVLYGAQSATPGHGLFLFDRKSGKWNKVDDSELFAAGNGQIVWIDGLDGDQLVYHASGKLMWARAAQAGN